MSEEYVIGRTGGQAGKEGRYWVLNRAGKGAPPTSLGKRKVLKDDVRKLFPEWTDDQIRSSAKIKVEGFNDDDVAKGIGKA